MNSVSAKELIASLIERYESFDFYQDNGIIVCGEDIDEFMTYYKKPGKLCIEFSEIHKTNTNESEYGFSKLVMDEKQTKLKRFFEPAYTMVHSVEDCPVQSFLNKHFALGIMLPELQKVPAIQGIKNSVLKEDEIYNEMNCNIVTGDLVSSGDIELAIDKEEGLLRRVRLKESAKDLENNDWSSMPYSAEIHYKMVSLHEPPDTIFKID